MRYGQYNTQFRPSLIGSLSVNAITAVGAPIDTIGFTQVLAIIAANSVVGSNPGLLSFKVQETSNPAGTGTAWTDITNEALTNGSFTLSLTFASGTDPQIQAISRSTKLNDVNRLRYIRFHATCNSTTGLGTRFSAGFLLGKPDDTLYAGSPNTGIAFATGNTEFSRLI